MGTKTIKQAVKFEYTSDFSISEFKKIRKYGNFPELSDGQLEYIFNSNKWRFCCKTNGEVVAICRFLTDQASILLISDIVVHPDWQLEKLKIPERLVESILGFIKGVLQPNEKLQIILSNVDEWSKKQLTKLDYIQSNDFFCKVIEKE